MALVAVFLGVVALSNIGLWAWTMQQPASFQQGFSDYVANANDKGIFQSLWAANEGLHTYLTGKRRYMPRTLLACLLDGIKKFGTGYWASLKTVYRAYASPRLWRGRRC